MLTDLPNPIKRWSRLEGLKSLFLLISCMFVCIEGSNLWLLNDAIYLKTGSKFTRKWCFIETKKLELSGLSLHKNCLMIILV